MPNEPKQHDLSLITREEFHRLQKHVANLDTVHINTQAQIAILLKRIEALETELHHGLRSG